MQLKDYAENGLALTNIPVIDVHCHLGSPADPLVPYRREEEQVVPFIKTMERVGVDYAIISMLRGLHSDELEANLDLAKIMEKHRQILGWVTYIPWLQQKSLEIAETCFNVSNRFIGMKIHPDINKYPMNGPLYTPCWEYADSKGLLVLVHTWSTGAYSNPAMLRGIAETYKNATILIGHSGGMGAGIPIAIELANKYDNLYLDLTGAFIYSTKTLDYFAEHADPEKLLFSSDATFNDLTWEIGNILYARISDDMKEKILGLNAKRLLSKFIGE